MDTRPKIDIKFEENSPHQEGIILEFYLRPNKSYFQELKDLESLVNTHNLVQKFLPKQADIDKIKINSGKGFERYASFDNGKRNSGRLSK